MNSMSFERSYSIESHERIKLILIFGNGSLLLTWWVTIISISLSLHLVLLAPVNSCELHNYHLVLSFLLMYSSSGLSTDVFFPNKTNINTITITVLTLQKRFTNLYPTFSKATNKYLTFIIISLLSRVHSFITRICIAPL